MGSGVIYYEIERHDKYGDSDERANSDFAVVKTRRYHCDDEPFVHPLHSIRFDPNRSYELPIESLLALKRKEPSTKRESTSRDSGSLRKASLMPQYSPLNPVVRLGSPSSPLKEVSSSRDRRIREVGRPIRSWELIPPSEGWMCEGDEVEDKGEEVEKKRNTTEAIEGGERKEGEDEKEEEDPEEDKPKEEMLALPRPMDVDADEDYLHYLEELRQHHEYSPIHSSQAFPQRSSVDDELSGIWPPSVGPSQ
ncbi:hypothetical protein PIB30_089802 [Stylosanthes scabra]|uniref:Uncharacterized protein n=1 Tax=Stylosanthes scabra TaxID=79078 RepID=A0ABU6RUC7_9FABA|nr:hypothetical protein [Stylosanthes scabra]